MLIVQAYKDFASSTSAIANKSLQKVLLVHVELTAPFLFISLYPMMDLPTTYLLYTSSLVLRFLTEQAHKNVPNVSW